VSGAYARVARRSLHSLLRYPVRILIFVIELYRTYVSPTRLPVCRFTPTCSEYAVTALREYGLLRGVPLAVIRLAKCAPWHPGGWDPVPEKSAGTSPAIPHDLVLTEQRSH